MSWDNGEPEGLLSVRRDALLKRAQMTREAPLHVQVAEALGCKARPLEDYKHESLWWCYCSGDEGCPATGCITGGLILHYDTDWAATGPLIEKYQITIGPLRIDPDGLRMWQAISLGLYPSTSFSGPTPLIAVCNLILALHKAGKL